MTHQMKVRKKVAGAAAIAVGLVFLQGCGEQGDERLREKAALESGEGARKGVEAENENIIKWSKELEADLKTRQRFFKALRGTFMGTLSSNGDEYEMKIRFVPSIPPYDSDRVRTIDEVRFELLNLYFNVQVLSWKKSNPLTAVGCRFEEIRPDLENGQINLTSEECPNFYSVNVYEQEEGIHNLEEMIDRAIDGKSRDIAKKVLNAELPYVEQLVGEMQPTSNSNTYEFSLERE